MDKDGGTRRRWPWVVLGTGLAAFFTVAVVLSIAAAGPGPGLAPAAPSPTDRAAAAASHPSCGSANTICPGLVARGEPLSPAQAAALQPRSHRVEQAVSAIDWCAAPDHGPCTGQGRTVVGTTSLTDRDVEVVRAALDRAGFPGAQVSLYPSGADAAGLVMIRYTVALGPGCVT